MISKIFCCAK